jgi:hypothetical protein
LTRTVYYDGVSSDPATFLHDVSCASGEMLDALAARLDVQREAGEKDDDLRTRTVKAACSCRGSVHVLGTDRTAWPNCECGDRTKAAMRKRGDLR